MKIKFEMLKFNGDLSLVQFRSISFNGRIYVTNRLNWRELILLGCDGREGSILVDGLWILNIEPENEEEH